MTVAICFLIILAISKASKKMEVERKIASAFYDSKNDCWRVRGNYIAIAQIIENRIKHGKPGSVKYID
ncbi:hypothetical protein FKF61_21855 [Salmonella enterica]|nr:hypothetical protein [Salmonella enterica]